MSSFSRCARAAQRRNRIEWSICTVAYPPWHLDPRLQLIQSVHHLTPLYGCIQTDTLSRLRYISLPTFSVSSELMPSHSLEANPLARERSCGTLPSNGSSERNKSRHLFMSLRSCRRLASPNSTMLMTGSVMLSS